MNWVPGDKAVNEANMVSTHSGCKNLQRPTMITSDLNLYIMHAVYHGKYFLPHF